MEWLKKCDVQLQKLLWWLVFRSLTYKEKKILTNVLKVLIYEIFLKTSYEKKKKTIIILEHMGLFTTKSTPHPSWRH